MYNASSLSTIYEIKLCGIPPCNLESDTAIAFLFVSSSQYSPALKLIYIVKFSTR
jgi:hypothetical protein